MLLCPNQKIQLVSIKCSNFKFYLDSGFQSVCTYLYDITNLVIVLEQYCVHSTGFME